MCVYWTSLTGPFFLLIKEFYCTRYQGSFLSLNQCGEWFSLPAYFFFSMYITHAVSIDHAYISRTYTHIYITQAESIYHAYISRTYTHTYTSRKRNL